MNQEAYKKMKEFIESQTQKSRTREELEEIAAKDNSDSSYVSEAFFEGCDAVEAHFALRCRDLLLEIKSIEKFQYIKDNLK